MEDQAQLLIEDHIHFCRSIAKGLTGMSRSRPTQIVRSEEPSSGTGLALQWVMILRCFALVAAFAVFACGTEPLSLPGLDGGADLATSSRRGSSCGDTICRVDQVCVHPQCADCVSPLDGGTCPSGYWRDYCPTGGKSCVSPYHDVYMNECADLKPGCASSNPCDCVATQLVACEPLGAQDVATLCY